MSFRHLHARRGAALIGGFVTCPRPSSLVPILSRMGMSLIFVVASHGFALAQADDLATEETAPEADAADETLADDAELEGTDSAGGEESEAAAAEADAVADALDQGVTEQAGKQYLFLGARYRAVIIPTFIQGLFADGGETIVAHTPGLEFVMREDGFEYNLGAQLGFYNADDVPFKGANDDANAWEIIDMDYQILTLGADFMWSTDEFTPGLSLTYGAGLGLGIVFGSLTRTQAFPAGGDVGDPDSYVRCIGPNRPATSGDFCGNDNDHYNGFEEPSWADGGSSPLIFPWISGQIGLRYKLHRNFVSRVELGIMPTGGFFGVGADYGL